jgi:hypothetical protein
LVVVTINDDHERPTLAANYREKMSQQTKKKRTKSKRSATLDNVLEYYVKTLANCDPTFNNTTLMDSQHQ